jgi:hypothetical protein
MFAFGLDLFYPWVISLPMRRCTIFEPGLIKDHEKQKNAFLQMFSFTVLLAKPANSH